MILRVERFSGGAPFGSSLPGSARCLATVNVGNDDALPRVVDIAVRIQIDEAKDLARHRALQAN